MSTRNVHYDIVNKPGTPRLFENPLLEKLSHVHYAAPIIIYVPVILYFLYRSITKTPFSAATIVALFVAGVAFWTLFEYLAHRFAFHFEPRSDFGKKIAFLIHGVHHKYPNDPLRLVMPPAASIPLAIIMYFVFVLVLGPTYTAPTFAGFILGYLLYDMTHYAVHHASIGKSQWARKLKRHHVIHHFYDDEKAYGVSSTLWDHIFRTMPQEKGEVVEEVEEDVEA
jgi:sterol desaturase/sphingolipid hydroxylase (fatty acid hydroxylase superfamily)